MRGKRWMAMLLAGGEGRRLGVLTKDLAKPAVPFGGKYRIIDFTLSNCARSGIDTVGVLTQYQPYVLNRYLGNGSPWGLDRMEGGMSILPPYMKQKGGVWYKGTANAIYQNMNYIERHRPEYVMVISGDHIYKMDYTCMLQEHIRKEAEATIAVIKVKWSEASRFGIMKVNRDGRIIEFAEKPANPESNLASMGVYIFSWEVLKEYLIRDEANAHSSSDFGKDIIPAMLKDGIRLQSYAFDGYWKDVGTIESLWEANMDLLAKAPPMDLNDREHRISSVNANYPPHYIASTAYVRSSLISEGCLVRGEVDRSVLSCGVMMEEGSLIRESVILSKAKIGRNARIYRAIIGEGVVIPDGVVIGSPNSDEVTVVGSDETISRNVKLQV